MAPPCRRVVATPQTTGLGEVEHGFNAPPQPLGGLCEPGGRGDRRSAVNGGEDGFYLQCDGRREMGGDVAATVAALEVMAVLANLVM